MPRSPTARRQAAVRAALRAPLLLPPSSRATTLGPPPCVAAADRPRRSSPGRWPAAVSSAFQQSGARPGRAQLILTRLPRGPCQAPSSGTCPVIVAPCPGGGDDVEFAADRSDAVAHSRDA